MSVWTMQDASKQNADVTLESGARISVLPPGSRRGARRPAVQRLFTAGYNESWLCEMLSAELLVRHEKRYSGKAHKAPYLYSFKK
jgi:hypothetical protein